MTRANERHYHGEAHGAESNESNWAADFRRFRFFSANRHLHFRHIAVVYCVGHENAPSSIHVMMSPVA
jgi:hypothetical protein